MLAIGGALAWVTRDQGRIYPNVFVGGRRVGGLTPAEARRALVDVFRASLDRIIEAAVGDRTHRCSLRDVGIAGSLSQAVHRAYAVGRTGSPVQRFADRLQAHWHPTSIGLPLMVDAARARAFAEACARRFDRAPVNAHAEIAGSSVRIAPGKSGVRVEAAKTLAAIQRWADGGCRGELRLPVRLTAPAITARALKGIDTVLASVSTTLAGSSRNRRHNIAVAASAVDGLVLARGAVFSYNGTVGPRTEDRGYRTAPVIIRGQLVPGTGGGACQLSSTLYQVALRAGLKVIARSHHSHPVPYTPAGFDATVVYEALDLKFRNSLRHPVMLWAQVQGGGLVCRALGHGPAPGLELVRQVTSIDPPEPQVIEDPEMAPGERRIETASRPGLRVRVYRRVKDAPARAAELISTDHYAAQAEVIRVGRAAPAEPAPAQAAPGPEGGEQAGGEGSDQDGASGGAPAGGGSAPGGEPKKPAR